MDGRVLVVIGAERYVAKTRSVAYGKRLQSILMTVEVVTEPSDLQAAWSNQYEKLAHVFADALGKKGRRIAEIGCGRGQLAIPLAKRAKNLQFVLVDRFVGTNYSKNYNALLRNLRKTTLMRRAHIAVSDYMKWITTQNDGTYEAVVSSEFIPEIDSDETHRFIQECYRVLKPKGVTIHSFLSPIPRNLGQKLLITADSNPLWTRTPPKEWFSPNPKLVIKELREAGFYHIRKTSLRAHLIMKGDAARSWLKGVEVKANFYETYKKVLIESGLDVPDWVIVSGAKS
jgi:cyclopropane fatty-acyl-phospholipid synthase-like methyltransferase